jgi:hypothetical protein
MLEPQPSALTTWLRSPLIRTIVLAIVKLIYGNLNFGTYYFKQSNNWLLANGITKILTYNT